MVTEVHADAEASSNFAPCLFHLVIFWWSLYYFRENLLLMAQKESQLTGSSAVDFGIITAHSILLPTNHTAGTIERREDGIRSEI